MGTVPQSPFSPTSFHLLFLFSESLWQWDFRHSVLLTKASLSWCLGLCHFIAFSFWFSRYSWNLCIWVKGNIGPHVRFISNMHPWKKQLYCHCYIFFGVNQSNEETWSNKISSLKALLLYSHQSLSVLSYRGPEKANDNMSQSNLNDSITTINFCKPPCLRMDW